MIPKTTNATERTSVPIHFIIISPLIPITINATIAIIPTITWTELYYFLAITCK